MPSMTIHVYSSREGMNVVIPGTGYKGEGNHQYPYKSGEITKTILRRVHEALKEEAEGSWWKGPQERQGLSIYIRETAKSGHYVVTVREA